ncbi:MAG: mannosyltransferase [Flavobacteriales bacterium]|nr:mannosyltransferase [Flavobacteriales bacterium]
MYFAIGYAIPRSSFGLLISSIFGLFLTYGFLVKKAQNSFNTLLTFGILARLIFVFSIPNLSDDFYRFIWDGTLIKNGVNPFLNTPEFYMNNPHDIVGLDEGWYEKMNSPKYFTIYPPIGQLLSYLACVVSPQSLLGKVIFMKAVLFFCEIGTIFFGLRILRALNKPLHNIHWYALNPLVIIELVGNIHFEAMMIFFLTLSFYLLMNDKWKKASLVFALSICSKLVPLLLAPLLLRKLGYKKGFLFLILAGVCTLLMFSPFISIEFVQNFASSLDLYFQKFEFNASVYYVIRWIGYQVKGYNIIQTLGPILSIITLLIISSLSLFINRNSNWVKFFGLGAYSWLVYLLFATIVHPWYISSIVLLCAFGKPKFALLWSCLAFLSYFAYSNIDFKENLLLITVEYVLMLGFLFWEIKTSNLRPESNNV